MFALAIYSDRIAIDTDIYIYKLFVHTVHYKYTHIQCVYIYIYMYVYIYIYRCMYIYICIYMYKYVYIYIYIDSPFIVANHGIAMWAKNLSSRSRGLKLACS